MESEVSDSITPLEVLPDSTSTVDVVVKIGFQTDVDWDPLTGCMPATDWTATKGRQVHGRCRIPHGFAIAPIELGTEVHPFAFEGNQFGSTTVGGDEKRSEQVVSHRTRSKEMSSTHSLEGQVPKNGNFCSSDDLSSSYSFSRALIAVVQLVFASMTIYQSKGDQITRYGYAAFGLTVVPYLTMSFINLLGAMLTPDYSHVYLVSSEIMEEARRRGGHFEGLVGTVGAPPVREGLEGVPILDPLASSYNHRHVDMKFHENGDQITIQALNDSQSILSLDIDRTLENSRKIEFRYVCQWPVPPDSLNIPKFDTVFTRHVTLLAGIWIYVVFFLESIMMYMPYKQWAQKTLNLVIPVGPPNRSIWQGSTANMIRTTFICYGYIFAGLFSLASVGILTKFKNGDSSRAERGWIMSWLVTGTALGAFGLISVSNNSLGRDDNWVTLSRKGLFAALYCTPAIGGFVVVGRMLSDYGNCVKLY
jgi:hypothetical protein